jgi:hypothetical protein
VGGFAFRFFAGDHDPPHVHAVKGGEAVVLVIESGRVRKILGMRDPDIARAQALVDAHRDVLRAAWVAWQEERRKGPDGLAKPHG